MDINLFPALPEIFIAIMIIVVLLVDAFFCKNKNSEIIAILAALTLVGAGILQIFVVNSDAAVTFAFNDMFILDPITYSVSHLVYMISLIILIYSRRYIYMLNIPRGEFYAIFLFAILGMLIMISASHMLILYLGLELLSLALCGLIALDRENVRATEAAIKFFVLSALASGLLLYGISFIYGVSGHLQLNDIFKVLYHGEANDNINLLVFGVVFIVAGLAFKLGLVPFHMWMPDVYDGAKFPVVIIIGTLSKLVTIVFLMRFLIGGLVLLNSSWSLMLQVLAIMSLVIGNIVAISQTNIKRMLGYSAIAQMAFVALGMMTVTFDGVAASFFYITTYIITSLAGFGVLMFLSKNNYECEKISDLQGLSQTHPIYAGIFLLVMLSFAGIPPLVGFYAKFKILSILVATGYIRTAVFAVVMSLIGAFYYLRVIKVMYFDKRNDLNSPLNTVDTLSILSFSRIILVANGIIILLIGFMPDNLMNYCLRIISG